MNTTKEYNTQHNAIEPLLKPISAKEADRVSGLLFD